MKITTLLKPLFVYQLFYALIMASAFLSASAFAASEKRVIGVSISNIDSYLSLLVTELTQLSTAADLELIIKDAKSDYEAQRKDIAGFIDAKVDALIVIPVITESTVSFSTDANIANIPLVYLNTLPININLLPEGQTYVGSYEWDAGAYQANFACRVMRGEGRVVIMTGQLSQNSALFRTKAISDVFTEPRCSDMKIVAEQTAEWSKDKGEVLMTQWLSAGLKFDVVIANNDDMALGAIDALKKIKGSTEGYTILGVDATPQALEAMSEGELHFTVYQNAHDQAEEAIEAVTKLLNKERVSRKIYVPFQVITPDNLYKFIGE
jgi:inositol transport system substrate-binding protein